MRNYLSLFLAASLACAAQETPLTSFPYTPGLDVAAMDKSADPCVDFYQYTCGGWMKGNPIPSDQPRWDVYRKLGQDNQRYLKSRKELAALLGSLHLATADDGLFFGFGSDQDYSNSTQVIAFASSGGLGLPDRDYYLKDDDKSKEVRAKYLAHVAKMFELLGDAPDAAKANAQKVIEIETALAKASLTRVERRDPYKLFHKMDLKGLQALTPGFDWREYLKAAGLRPLNTFNVTEPAFYQELERQWQSRNIDDIKTYLRWHLAADHAQLLSSAFVNENFNFYAKQLRGVPELRPRWKRCVALVDRQLGEALGQEFVSRAFSPQLKQRTLHMTRQIEKAMADDIKSLTWMSEATKKRALEKLRTIVNKIGYPDKWRDYTPVKVKRDDFVGNVERATLFESRRQLAKIGKPLDRGEWGMTPPTVNAYYNPQMNDINFPAGVLQPPLFDAKMDDAPNYGNTGGTIGHELTHGFDDQGRQFDAQGNLKDWWTQEDAKEFTDRAQCIIDQYKQYTVVDDIKINSELTQGEDIADLGGLILAWMAWKTQTEGTKLIDRDGLTPEQRFFVGYAQWACENNRPENQRVHAMTDPHSPGKYRVNGLVVNMPEFTQAFACKPGQPMVSERRCRVW